MIAQTNTIIAFYVQLYSNEKLFGVWKTSFCSLHGKRTPTIIRIVCNIHKFAAETRVYSSRAIACGFGCRFRGEPFVLPNTINNETSATWIYARVHNSVTVVDARSRAKPFYSISKNKRVVTSTIVARHDFPMCSATNVKTIFNCT